MKLILLVEDELELADTLVDGLETHGYRVHHTEDAEEALVQTAVHRYDAMIVDWMLPGMNGPDLIRKLRDKDYVAPALMLTVRDSIEDRVQGLESGADDYLTKPFSFEELLARIRALLRRPSEWSAIDELRIGALHMDTATRKVEIKDAQVELRKKEFDLLRLLVERAPAVVSRTMIAERVWGSEYVSDNAIDVTISGLRHNMQDAQNGGDDDIRLETVRGVGYRLHAD
ncbi:response regulator transcription factor [Longibacter sp.]|uniref:response regulator transcription factor n=1 Tax=Longibacter sp. TaxID=2045415 RepID=UPI003EC12EE9